VTPAVAFQSTVASPVVEVDLVVPQAAASTGVIPCKIMVRNRSQADAYNVVVRVPLARMKQSQIAAAEPAPVAAVAGDASYRWRYGTLRTGESKTIAFDLKPDPQLVGTGDLTLKAFVSFEHGVEAVVKFGTAKLEIQKFAPKEAPVGEPVSVSVQVRNTGNAALHDVVATETISGGFAFAEGTTGAEVPNSPGQRQWKIGTLAPGETRSFGYRATAATPAGDLETLTKIATKEGEQITKKSETKLVRAGLAIQLRGDAEVAPGERTTYTIKVTNVGDMTQRNLAVVGSVPDGCRVTKMTNGGRVGRDRVDWTIPELKGGASYELRYVLVADSGGKRSVTAVVRDERGKEASDTKQTSFAAAADLSWESTIDPAAIAVGKTGVLTVRVRNRGGEAARGVTLKIELPDQVRRMSARPRDIKEAGREIIFPTETIPSGASRTYDVEFKAEVAGRGTVNLKLEAESFGANRPLTAEKMIAVTAAR
jgi:uncharacterized repeat protein (TIGR01451 family)